jgi:hypothetical protein
LESGVSFLDEVTDVLEVLAGCGRDILDLLASLYVQRVRACIHIRDQ